MARKRPPRDPLPLLTLLPNLLTILGLCAGLTAIRFAIDGRFEIAAGLIVLAAVIDGLDGPAARRLRAESAFGAELDSLSDFVCFGVAPGVVVYLFALGGAPDPGWIFVLIYVIGACLRLARFNVGLAAPVERSKAAPRFVGVPAPAGAMLALLPVFASHAELIDFSQHPLIVAPYLGLVALLMVSRVPTLSPRALRVPRERAPWLLIGVAILVGVMLTRVWLFFVMLDLLYALTLIWVGVTSRRQRAD